MALEEDTQFVKNSHVFTRNTTDDKLACLCVCAACICHSLNQDTSLILFRGVVL